MWLVLWLIHTGAWGFLGVALVYALLAYVFDWGSGPWGFEKWD